MWWRGGQDHKRKRGRRRGGQSTEGTGRGPLTAACGREGKQGRYLQGMGARLVLERGALPQEALVRDLALGLHAGTEGRQQRRRLRWMAPGMAHGRPGSRSDATDAAVAGLCGRAVVAGLSTSCSQWGCSMIRGVARACAAPRAPAVEDQSGHPHRCRSSVKPCGQRRRCAAAHCCRRPSAAAQPFSQRSKLAQ